MPFFVLGGEGGGGWVGVLDIGPFLAVETCLTKKRTLRAHRWTRLSFKSVSLLAAARPTITNKNEAKQKTPTHI